MHDHEWEPVPDPVLAKLQRLQRLGRKPSATYDFFASS